MASRPRQAIDLPLLELKASRITFPHTLSSILVGHVGASVPAGPYDPGWQGGPLQAETPAGRDSSLFGGARTTAGATRKYDPQTTSL